MNCLLAVLFVKIAYGLLSAAVVALVIAFGVGPWSGYYPRSDSDQQ